MASKDAISANITPAPGFILVKPYIPKETFKSLRAEVGEAQKSEIIAVGEPYRDDNDNLRAPREEWKPGVIIIHGDNNNDFTYQQETRRFVHFTRVLGVIHES